MERDRCLNGFGINDQLSCVKFLMIKGTEDSFPQGFGSFFVSKIARSE